VPTGYGYVLPDQNGWSRALHFQTAWILVFSGVWYWVAGAVTSHFRRRLLPSASALAPSSLLGTVKSPLRFRPAGTAGVYNPLQQIAYLAVIFGAFPLIIWTGLAMSPAVTSAFPFLVEVLGGHQSARTLHFVATVLLSGFVLGHVLLVWRAGFRERMRGMITGG
jgi:thiosulfate reductase cytochrome b subunit